MPDLIAGMKHISVNEASQYGGWLLFVYALMQFVSAPILGALIDQYGHRPVLCFRKLDDVCIFRAVLFAWNYKLPLQAMYNSMHRELQGIFTSLMSLTSIVGPLLMTYIFYFFTKKSAPIHFPEASFFVGLY